MNIEIRKAKRDDVASIVRLLASDPLGAQRELYQDPLPEKYYSSFEEINFDKNNYLVVAEADKKIVGTLQLTLIPYLTYQGGKRALIEAVRVDDNYRGQGLGKEMLQWAITQAQELGCHLVQLTTDKKRPDALEFYKSLGFVSSHEGLKLSLNS